MVAMLTMMLASLVLASNVAWPTAASCPAQCLFQEPQRDYTLTGPYMFALIQHYGTSIWRVFDTSRIDQYTWHYPSRQLRRILQRSKRTNSDLSNRCNMTFRAMATRIQPLQWAMAFVLGIYLAIATVLGSMTVNLYYDIVWFVFGILSIISTRDIFKGEIDGNENQFSFGQIVSVLLCASILLAFKEVYTGKPLLQSFVKYTTADVRLNVKNK